MKKTLLPNKKRKLSRLQEKDPRHPLMNKPQSQPKTVLERDLLIKLIQKNQLKLNNLAQKNKKNKNLKKEQRSLLHKLKKVEKLPENHLQNRAVKNQQNQLQKLQLLLLKIKRNKHLLNNHKIKLLLQKKVLLFHPSQRKM